MFPIPQREFNPLHHPVDWSVPAPYRWTQSTNNFLGAPSPFLFPNQLTENFAAPHLNTVAVNNSQYTFQQPTVYPLPNFFLLSLDDYPERPQQTFFESGPTFCPPNNVEFRKEHCSLRLHQDLHDSSKPQVTDILTKEPSIQKPVLVHEKETPKPLTRSWADIAMSNISTDGSTEKQPETAPTQPKQTQGKTKTKTKKDKQRWQVRRKGPSPDLVHLKTVNPTNFDSNPDFAKFFVIKSFSEDDIHKSIKYSIWTSTDAGNRRLDKAYKDCCGKGPLYLFFSVNGSGQFCGIAEMTSPFDVSKRSDCWNQDKWKGQFSVQWRIIKDISNTQLRHIRLENNENKPVTNSRDTQEILYNQGCEMLKIFSNYQTKTSILNDFSFYNECEEKEKEVKKKR